MTAAITAAAVSVVGMGASSYMASEANADASKATAEATKYAADKQAESAANAIAAQQAASEQQQQLMQPYNQLGYDAIPGYTDYLNQSSSLYGNGALLNAYNSNEFQSILGSERQQYMKQAAAAGGVTSGSTPLYLQTAALNSAQTYLANQQNAANQRLSQLTTPVQLGQAAAAGTAANIGTTANQVSNIQSNAANNIGNLAIQGAQIQGQAAINNANIWGNAITSATGYLSGYWLNKANGGQ